MFRPIKVVKAYSVEFLFIECPFCKKVQNLTYHLDLNEAAYDECINCFADFEVVNKGEKSSNFEKFNYEIKSK